MRGNFVIISSQDGNIQADQVGFLGCRAMRSKRAVNIIADGLRIAKHFGN
jgi:hypothetical protein